MDVVLGKLLNSSIGTTEMLPLDKLIQQQKSLVASSTEPLYTILTDYTAPIGVTPVLRFAARVAGSISLRYQQDSSSSRQARIHVSVNGGTATVFSPAITSSAQILGTVTYPDNAVVEISTERATGGGIQDLTIMAHVVDNPLVITKLV